MNKNTESQTKGVLVCLIIGGPVPLLFARFVFNERGRELTIVVCVPSCSAHHDNLFAAGQDVLDLITIDG